MKKPLPDFGYDLSFSKDERTGDTKQFRTWLGVIYDLRVERPAQRGLRPTIRGGFLSGSGFDSHADLLIGNDPPTDELGKLPTDQPGGHMNIGGVWVEVGAHTYRDPSKSRPIKVDTWMYAGRLQLDPTGAELLHARKVLVLTAAQLAVEATQEQAPDLGLEVQLRAYVSPGISFESVVPSYQELHRQFEAQGC